MSGEIDQTLSPEDSPPKAAPFPIVGIGASAGGLESFSQLLAALPVDTGLAFVLVQHLEPSRKSHLSEILSRSTAMPVVDATHGMRIEPNHVYVIPPNTELGIEDRFLRLSLRGPNTHPLTVDSFFHALAADQRRLAIGVVLSGTGSDGALGLKAIKSACGITFAQDEDSAQYPAMPRNAFASGAVDFVASPGQIAVELARIGKHRFFVSPNGDAKREELPEGDGELKQIYTLLSNATGVSFQQYKQKTIRRRIGRRMLMRRIEALPEYLTILEADQDELDELYSDLLINVTSFERDPEAFAALGEHFAQMANDEQLEESFRAWIPGCSSGEEVYSIVMTALDVFRKADVRPNIQVFGTDISEKALSIARAGVYSDESLQNVSPERLDRYFRRVDGSYQINKEIRESCVFARHNLTRDTPFSRLDLVSCRNLLIYLEPALQRKVMPVFHYALNPSGVLFLGSAETITSDDDLFTAANEKYKVYVRKTGSSRLPPHSVARKGGQEAPVQAPPGSTSIQKRLSRIIEERYTPDSVVIDQDLRILQFRGQTALYLEQPRGEATHQLLRMAREGLRHSLRELTSHAIRENTVVEKKRVYFEQKENTYGVDLEIIPLTDASEKLRFFFVVFKPSQDGSTRHSVDTAIAEPNRSDARVRYLEAELSDLRQHLHSVSEDYETALEDVTAANEELQSSNEELQSSNEELATTKEELQSTNEELTTLNEELDTTNQQLGSLNDDLSNLFGTVSIPIFRVDRELCLRRYSPAAEESFGISATDLNQPLRYLQTRIGAELDLDRLSRQAMQNLIVHSENVQDSKGRSWSLSIRPYRTSDDRLDGAVLTFVDTDLLNRALQASQSARQYADAIIETVREPLAILGPQLQVERANAAFYAQFQLSPIEAEGRGLHELPHQHWAFPQLQTLLEEISPEHSAFADFEMRQSSYDKSSRLLLLNARQIELDSGRRILLAFEDITDRRIAEDSISRQLTQTDRELDRTKEELRALTARLMTAHEEEQRRISRELHDDIVQRLGFLVFQVEQSRMGALGKSSPEAATMLANLQSQITDLSEATRNISHGLHPAILDDLGLVAALRKLAKDTSRGRALPIRFVVRIGSCSIPRRHFAAGMYRIAQEALHNANKHAPDSELTLSLACRDNHLLLKVRDHGPGFEPTQVRGVGGLGIVSMEERARLLGATIKIRSKPGAGAVILVRAPLPESGDLN